ncbi:DNA gyrase inhibitor YacG [Pelagibaculum spongiae]|uniref:DNA gyrase inhibitor YacG n=1 Tax=Pelagibaculum spongiae TaxID=2080658 RepID=A0A2V1GXG4_9GAMM|nr:DNA gyrase inhibitor YacG [Pelagibaculum spongiae]PVZ71861.1 DNA gyrase inhibitor YacG [Pelagibaculum spongiae]
MTDQTSKSEQRIHRCPQCKKSMIWSTDNPWRPFCCERCRQIDFGDWADEKHRIAGDPVPNNSQDLEDDYL